MSPLEVQLTCACYMNFLHPRIDLDIAGGTPARTALVIRTVGGHSSVVDGGVVGVGPGGDLAGGVAHVRGGGERRRLGSGGRDWRPAPVTGQLTRRVATVGDSVRN